MQATARLLSALSLLLAGCAFHSTATQWNKTVGPDGNPVFIKSTTNVGLNLFVLLKVLGGTDTPGMIEELTEEIAEEEGDRVRIIQSDTENYWYGFPPITWFVTPVITTVTAEYHPSEGALAAARAGASEED